ncbi:MAG TPA: hypothetical protein VJ725_14500 [Thermoanaerobaculia bacterium]|nr:hypothetical protein [Thermoanaerobaculia bacterium]
MRRKPFVTILTCGVLAAPLLAQDCPLHAEHQKAAQENTHTALDHRGDEVMGFEHTRTTHHFLLKEDGGVIQVEVNDSGDAASLAQIRSHLAEVARSFAAGDFAMPAQIHDRVLPGVPDMTRLAREIEYRYEDLERGGRVRITTGNPEARAAVHAFLKSQIADHRTGDPLEVSGGS